MGQRSKVGQLPREVREWLDRALADKNFAGYVLLEEELKARGYAIGKSSIQRYGTALERRIMAVKASTEAARAIAAAAPDDADLRSAAVMSLIQTQTFETLVNMEEAMADVDPLKKAKVLAAVAKNIAILSRASVNQKRHELEMRARAKAAADAVDKITAKGGLSKAAAEQIRSQILGIAV